MTSDDDVSALHDDTTAGLAWPPFTGGSPQYDPPPPYKPSAPASSTPRLSGAAGSLKVNRLRGVRRVWVGVGAVVVLSLSVLGYVLSSSASSGAKTPTAAVQKLLNAGTNGDLKMAESVLCSGDRALGGLSHLQNSGTITTYTIGRTSTEAGLTIVDATFTSSTSSAPTTQGFPVVQEGGSWKVCFSKALASIPTSLPATAAFTGRPSDSFTNAPLPSYLPSIPGEASLCEGSTSGFGVASTYVGAAVLGLAQVAQSCVYQGEVPGSIISRLSGKLFAPVTTDQFATVIEFRSTDGLTKLTVSTAKESDGHYYVTAVAVS